MMKRLRSQQDRRYQLALWIAASMFLGGLSVGAALRYRTLPRPLSYGQFRKQLERDEIASARVGNAPHVYGLSVKGH